MLKKRRFFRTDIALYLFLALQVTAWFYMKQYTPNLKIVPDVPSKLSVKAISLGDEQFYFRTLAFKLQNAGDTFGQFTALKDYNYNKLYHWFSLLDTLDERSNFVPALAGYYFSQTQNVPDTRYVVQYLNEHASRDLYNKWWWMGQAVYIANHKLKDKELALELAYKLASTPRDDIPLWVKQMPAFIHEQRGEEAQALQIIAHVLDNVEDIDDGELNFMSYFITDRLKRFIKDHPELERLMQHQANKEASSE
jgi:hypothetical protein